MFVSGCGLCISDISYQVKDRMEITKPFLCAKCDETQCTFDSIPKNAGAVIDMKLVVGSMLFAFTQLKCDLIV